jgi:hypothetical protein
MSGYRIHTIIYLALSVAVTYLLKDYLFRESSLETILFSIGIGAVYSILPDIDIPSSLIRRIVEELSLAAIVISITAYLLLQAAFFLYFAGVLAICLSVLWLFKHRTFFHSLAAAALLSSPLLLLDPLFAGYALLGYLTHLAIDGKIFHFI